MQKLDKQTSQPGAPGSGLTDQTFKTFDRQIHYGTRTKAFWAGDICDMASMCAIEYQAWSLSRVPDESKKWKVGVKDGMQEDRMIYQNESLQQS